ncbi:ABC transporter substrate-binding protein [Haloechinothrix salitolerans]|uniref:ABC transporter substrate-binding protein n=1 Tax=Haloechinothrix salitolerans TaxID=926830 RepID=A0ABW2C1D6_9PSEU
MGRFTRTGVAMGLATALAASAACSGGERTERSDSNTLRIAGPFEVHSLEPAASDGFFTRLQVVETLVSSDMRGELTPGLATSWSDAKGMRSWTFELPEDAEFHDGTPVTPDAVAASLEAAADEAASPLADAPVRRIVPVDSGVRFDLSAPYPTLPAVLTHYSTAALAPASYDDGHVTEVIGSGPYEIDRVELPASIEVSRFDEWRGDQPAIEKISFQAVGRAESRALMAVSFQADVVFGLEPAGRERVAATNGVAMESSLQPRTLLLKVNADHPVLGDVRVRQALSLALDRAGMADAVLREKELAATQLLPPSLRTWHEDGLEPLEHDPDAARDLLAEAGWKPDESGTLRKDGTPLRLTLTTYPDRPELPALATAIQASLREIGVEIEVDVTNSSEIPARHQDGSLELGLFARHFALVADPLVTVAETFAPQGEDWGVMNWRDGEVTKAVDGLLHSPSDDEAQEYRTRIVETAQQELPLIPVAWYRMNAAVSDRVANFELDPLERTWRVADVSWAEQ